MFGVVIDWGLLGGWHLFGLRFAKRIEKYFDFDALILTYHNLLSLSSSTHRDLLHPPGQPARCPHPGVRG